MTDHSEAARAELARGEQGITLEDLRNLTETEVLVKAWTLMYRAWEIGRLPSPSADDIYDAGVDLYGAERMRITADELYEMQCDGKDLPEVAAALLGTVRP